MNRRKFVTVVGSSAAGLLVTGSVTSCGGGDETTTEPPGDEGRIEGRVVNLQGAAQPSLGKIFLMYGSGLQTGRNVDVDPAGNFAFANVGVGDWQLRFHAPRVAYVPPQFPHPIRLSVEANRTTSVTVQVARGLLNSDMIEIYAGDDFYQEQPFGGENAEAVVRVGTVVCWYNVGLHPHTVTGGPWVDSGDMPRTASFIWIADRTGIFPYRCKYHLPQMQAQLRVIA